MISWQLTLVEKDKIFIWAEKKYGVHDVMYICPKLNDLVMWDNNGGASQRVGLDDDLVNYILL